MPLPLLDIPPPAYRRYVHLARALLASLLALALTALMLANPPTPVVTPLPPAVTHAA